MDTHHGIALRGVTHVYEPRGRPELTALDDVTFEVRPGEVVGLLGPNGAGKTTCVRILATLLVPTAGITTVGGFDAVSEPGRVRARFGVSFGGDLGLYTRLSARDNLRYFATMYRLDPSTVRSRIERLLGEVGLADRADDRVETYSRGMRQRLHLARAVLHDPPVLLLDEPSAGLDPQGARDLRDQVKRLAGEGRAILLTTHDMAEADELCSRVVVLSRGRVQRHATPHELREEASRRLGSRIEVSNADPPPQPVLEGIPGLIRWSWEDQVLRVYTSEPTRAVSLILKHLGEDATLQVGQPSLVEAYLDVVDPTPASETRGEVQQSAPS